MPFFKVVKNKAYFKRFQVKFKRRREGKTDFLQRRRLVIQDKTKYNSPKYRFVVRRTNKDIICQVIFATPEGDRVLSAAYSHELPRYGMALGLTNYAAAYATGLLLARRLLTKLKLDTKFEGISRPDGSYFCTGDDYEDRWSRPSGRKPFKCFLDVGLARTTTGARVFAALKGAVDGGLNIPHNENRFPGWKKEEETLDSGALRAKIFGEHVASYYRTLLDKQRDVAQRQFGRYIAQGITPEDIPALFEKVHAAIRANPLAVATKESFAGPDRRKVAQKPRSKAERADRVRQILSKRKVDILPESDDEDGDDSEDED